MTPPTAPDPQHNPAPPPSAEPTSEPEVDGADSKPSSSTLVNLNERIAREERITSTLESKSFSRLAWERFKRNTQAVVASLVVITLMGIGVFSPLLANNLPYHIETALPTRYEDLLFIVTDDVQHEVSEAAKAGANAKIPADRVASIENSFADLKLLLEDKHHAPLEAWWAEVRTAAFGAKIDADKVSDLSTQVLDEFDATKVSLAQRVYYPVFSLLSWLEFAFMVAFVSMVVGMPLRRFAGGPRMVLLATFAAFWIAGLSWKALAPQRTQDANNYKDLVARGIAKSAMFPPIPFGENENITGQVKEPPFWIVTPRGAANDFFALVQRALADGTKAPDGTGVAVGNRAEYLSLALASTTNEFQQAVSKEKFESMVNALSLTGANDVSWTGREAELRHATLKGQVNSNPAVDFSATMTIQRGRWRLWSLETNKVIYGPTNAPTSTTDRHWLGTDSTGRDLLSRMIYGTRIAMMIGVVSVSIYCTIGIIMGAMAGYFRGWFDILLSRFIEIIICFPYLFLILTIISFSEDLGVHPIMLIMIVFGVTLWTGIARLVRGEFLRLSNEEFVQAIRAVGGSNSRIIFKHILPNALGPVLVSVSFGIASAILAESGLSFLGLGVKQPAASWGSLLNNAREDIFGMWWMTLFPGLVIFVAVTCFNLMGEGVRDALDPKAIDKA